jgi:hypothetical protein
VQEHGFELAVDPDAVMSKLTGRCAVVTREADPCVTLAIWGRLFLWRDLLPVELSLGALSY